MKSRPIALVIFFLLSGCQAVLYGTADDLNSIRLGMSRDEVIKVMGPPATTSANNELREVRLTYSRMARVTGWSPTLYDIVLKDGVVVEFGAQP